MTASKKILNSNQIKTIAIIAMTIDHFTWLFAPGYQRVWWVIALHIIGRITAPIMWFFIAEGFYYTKNVKKYLFRLFLFAVISHFAYNLAGGISLIPKGIFNQTGVMWSLAWSVVLMMIYKSEKMANWLRIIITVLICLITVPSDWSCIAAMCPLFLYLHRGNFKRQAFDIILWSAMYATVYFLFLDQVYGIIQMFTALSIPVLALYNGKRGEWKGMKWLFYFYYPAHLFVIWLIRILIGTESIFP